VDDTVKGTPQLAGAATQASALDETPQGKETGRVEAFSDGVFAIAATLLVLTLQVPVVTETARSADLWRALLRQWPGEVAFVMSFLTILIMWSSHHNIFNHIRRVDHNFLLLNGLVLMFVSATPFATELLARYLDGPAGGAGAGVYAALGLGISVAYNALWYYASHDRRLLKTDASDEIVARITRQYRVAPVTFAAAVGLSFVSAFATVAVFVFIIVWFAVPSAANRGVGEG